MVRYITTYYYINKYKQINTYIIQKIINEILLDEQVPLASNYQLCTSILFMNHVKKILSLICV